MNKNYLICTSAFPICTICNLCNIKVTGSACNSPSDIINIFTLQSLFIFKIYLFCIFIYDSIIIKNRALTIVSIPIIAGENLYNVSVTHRKYIPNILQSPRSTDQLLTHPFHPHRNHQSHKTHLYFYSYL